MELKNLNFSKDIRTKISEPLPAEIKTDFRSISMEHFNEQKEQRLSAEKMEACNISG